MGAVQFNWGGRNSCLNLWGVSRGFQDECTLAGVRVLRRPYWNEEEFQVLLYMASSVTCDLAARLCGHLKDNGQAA